MTTFTMIFSGLICHVRANPHARHATLVKDRKHDQVLWLKAGDVVEAKNPFLYIASTGGWDMYNIYDCQIRLGGLPQGNEAIPDDRAVPRVGKFIKKFKPDSDVINGNKHDRVATCVTYSGGVFAVGCYHKEAARFSKDDPYECLAKELRWSLDTNNNIDLIDKQGHEMLIKRSATIGVTNWDKSAGNHDYELYYNLGKGDPPLQIETKENQCTEGACELPQPKPTLNVECTSSQWP